MATNEETSMGGQDASSNPLEQPVAENSADSNTAASVSSGALPADMPIPPADFTFLIYSLSTQAQLQLGLLRLDENSSPQANLPMARHTIDLLGMLQQKTQGNLSLSEKLLLENTLTDLRYRFVQVSGQASQ